MGLLGRIAMAAFMAATFYTLPAHAQATRTWVSGVGDDVNPCSRTAPCKTFAGAISKTAAGGEINCLDPGGFGTVTIIKSITIDCTGTLGSILASSTQGILVNGANVNVVIRGLTINGAPPTLPGTFGIRFLQGSTLTIEDVIIQNANAAAPNGIGIAFLPSTAATLNVINTTVVQSGTVGGGGGIRIAPTGASGSAVVSLNNVRAVSNGNAALDVDVASASGAGLGVNISVANSQFSGSATGIRISALASRGVSAVIIGSTVSQNGTGISVNGPSAQARVGSTTITLNGTGLSAGTGSLLTFLDNYVQGNSTNGSFSGTTPKT